MSLVYVFAASPMEGKPVEKLAVPPAPGSPGRCGPNQVMLATTGMGPRNAQKKAEAVLGLAATARRGVFTYFGGTGEVRDIINNDPHFIIDERHMDTIVAALAEGIEEVCRSALSNAKRG